MLEQKPRFMSIVLAAASSNVLRLGDQLTAALRSDLPAVLWRRGNGDSDSLRDAATWLITSATLGSNTYTVTGTMPQINEGRGPYGAIRSPFGVSP